MATSTNGREYGQDDTVRHEGNLPLQKLGKCARCGGLMVIVRCQDLMDNTGAINFFAKRCVLCGDLIDPVIQQNRVNPIVPSHRKKMRVRRPSPQAMHMCTTRRNYHERNAKPVNMHSGGG